MFIIASWVYRFALGKCRVYLSDWRIFFELPATIRLVDVQRRAELAMHGNATIGMPGQVTSDNGTIDICNPKPIKFSSYNRCSHIRTYPIFTTSDSEPRLPGRMMYWICGQTGEWLDIFSCHVLPCFLSTKLSK